MPRRALATFFERLVLATLPLAVPACGGSRHADQPPLDLSMVAPAGDDLAMPTSAPPDLAGDLSAVAGDDMALDPIAICDTGNDPPPVSVPFPADAVPDGGFPVLCHAGLFCATYCPDPYTSTCCGPTTAADGSLTISCLLDCNGVGAPGAGRRPPGLETVPASAGCGVGQYFAHVAHLEAASVQAFRVLGRELAAHGAPPRLVAACRQALRDEVRHARAMRRLAGAHGAVAARVRVTPAPLRSLEALAVENATEGCVRETFAALLALWQARAAADPTVRATMAAVAADEIRHAELAWEVHAWAERRLDAGARARVAEARRAAVAALATEVEQTSTALAARVGLPDRAQAQKLLAATASELWREAAA